MAAAEVIALLKADAHQFMAELDKAQGKVESVGKAGGSAFDKLATVGKAALIGIAGAAAGGAVAAVDLAEEYDVARSKLQAAAEGSGASFKAVQGQANKAVSEMAKYGYTSTQVEEATATLTIAQGKHVQVQKDLTLAANIAAARHIDLSSAINMVNKAAEGNTGALKRMGIDLPIVAGGAVKVKAAQDALSVAQQKVNNDLSVGAQNAAFGSKAFVAYHADLDKLTAAHQKLNDVQSAGTNVIKALTERFGGQAAAQAESFGGKIKALRAEGENLGVTIGNRILPVLESLVAKVQNAATWFEKHRGVAIALASAIGGVLAVAISAYVVNVGVKMVKSTVDAVEAVGKFASKVADASGSILSFVNNGVRGFANMVSSSAKWVATSAQDVWAWITLHAQAMAKWIASTAKDAAAWLALHTQALAKWVAETAASVAKWVATQAVALASAAKDLAVWAAEHTAAAAAFVAENVAMAASATAAFVAENAATLGIVAGIALLVAGVIYMATHWRQVWTDIKNWFDDAVKFLRSGFGEIILLIAGPIGWIILLATHWQEVWGVIKTVLSTAWDYMKPIFNFIKTLGTDLIVTNIQILQTVWNTAWSGISAFISNVWAGMKVIFGFIKTLGIDFIGNAIGGLETIWDSVWGAISGAVNTAWSIMKPVIDTINGAINGVKDAWNWLFGGGGAATPNSGKASQATSAGHAPTPGRALGGDVSGGNAYSVNEVGQEVFIPGISGTILNNRTLTNIASALGSGVTPLASSGGIAPTNNGTPVNFVLDGQVLARAFFPALQAYILQQQRGVSVPVFGTPQGV